MPSAQDKLLPLAAKLKRMLELRMKEMRKRIKKHPFNPFTLEPLKSGDVQTKVPPGATDYQLRKLRKVMGVKLPRDLVMWLRLANGPPGFFGIDTPKEFDGILWQVKKCFPSWPERGLIPVARDVSGCTYAQSIHHPSELGHAIVFMDLASDDSEPQYVVASNMINFAELRLLEEEHPRASSEQSSEDWVMAERKFVLSQDPAISSVRGLPYLWDTSN